MSGGRAGDAALAFPGATGVTLLDVYDWVAPDSRGGSAHIHLASTEGYLILRGAGRLQTLGAQGFREEPLHPGDCLWFTPGTVHRLVNEDGQLQILVIMQNAGLPEAGDCVLTFPPAASPTRPATRPRRPWPRLPGTAGTAAGTGTARLGRGWRPRPSAGGIWPSRGSPRCAPRWSGPRQPRSGRSWPPRSGSPRSASRTGATGGRDRRPPWPPGPPGSCAASRRCAPPTCAAARCCQGRAARHQPRYGMCGRLTTYDLAPLPEGGRHAPAR